MVQIQVKPILFKQKPEHSFVEAMSSFNNYGLGTLLSSKLAGLVRPNFWTSPNHLEGLL